MCRSAARFRAARVEDPRRLDFGRTEEEGRFDAALFESPAIELDRDKEGGSNIKECCEALVGESGRDLEWDCCD